MKQVHFIGIGGIGLSAIARILIEKGYRVSGSDRTPSDLTAELEQAGLKFFTGHAANNVAGVDIVVRSSAIPDDNPEVVGAIALNIPVLKRMDFLQQVLADKTVIAVAGTHGKTTTTSMAAWILRQAGKDPSFIIGGISKNLGTNAHSGSGSMFVIEADEYDRMFYGLHPEWAVITNVEHDHPDCFPTIESYREAFTKFMNQVKPEGGLLVCMDDKPAYALASETYTGKNLATYGFSPAADYVADKVTPNNEGGFSYLLIHQADGKPELIANVKLQVPGKHNVLNSLAAMAVMHRLGISLHTAGAALSQFSGTGRRFDVLGTAAGITIVDDYAHHPTEIMTTLEAARARYPGRRIRAVWQPHTFSRIKSLLEQFTTAFASADEVIVTEIYAAREKNHGFSAIDVAQKIKQPPARFIADFSDTIIYLNENLQSGDVLIVLSAGDANQVSRQVYQALQNREPAVRGTGVKR